MPSTIMATSFHLFLYVITSLLRPLQLHREDMVQSGLLPIRVWRNRRTDVHGPGGGVAGVGAAEEGTTF
ncbi:hypothetical protein Taro_017719 [Colocasia esculenta]|uniref:Secreted protein n=1 Tax=Colocasia esculenta TaxID=4460 RepID=A0A843UNV9_COLES|nr:hypothetical protein [Colocasia esculenta]